MLHHGKAFEIKRFKAFLFFFGQILGKIESQVDDLGCLLVFSIHLVAISAVGIHALGMTDIFLDSGLTSLILHE